MTVRFLTCDGSAPVVPPTTGAVAGAPGHFTPYGGTVPPDLAGLGGVTADPDTRWNPGDYVVLGDGSEAWWDGDSWEPGRAVVDPCIGHAPAISGVTPNPQQAGGTIRLAGSGFAQPGLAVMVAGQAATATLVNDTAVDVVIPAGTTPATNASIFLETDCGTANSLVNVTAPPPPPLVVTVALPDLTLSQAANLEFNIDTTATVEAPNVHMDFVINGGPAIDPASVVFSWQGVFVFSAFTAESATDLRSTSGANTLIAGPVSVICQLGPRTPLPPVGTYTATIRVLDAANAVLASDTSPLTVTA